MLYKLFVFIFAILIFLIGFSLATNHGGVAIRIANYLYALLFLLAIYGFLKEKK